MNIKCPKCGYLFESDSKEGEPARCPLCSEEFTALEAAEALINTTRHKRKSGLRTALDWAVFALSFSAFIVVIYLLVRLIAGV